MTFKRSLLLLLLTSFIFSGSNLYGFTIINGLELVQGTYKEHVVRNSTGVLNLTGCGGDYAYSYGTSSKDEVRTHNITNNKWEVCGNSTISYNVTAYSSKWDVPTKSYFCESCSQPYNRTSEYICDNINYGGDFEMSDGISTVVDMTYDVTSVYGLGLEYMNRHH